jgi:hypothetical protein
MEDIYAVRTSGDPNRRSPKYEVGLGCSRTDRPVHSDGMVVYLGGHSPYMSLVLAFPTSFGHQQPETYMTIITPEAFERLAAFMVKADPQAAIRAFGKAMQKVQLPTPDEK